MANKAKATKVDAADWYKTVFSNWQGKFMGRQPTAAELNTIHLLGARPGKQALAAAMALRPTGVTANQIIMACGAQQLNKMRAMVADHLVKWVATPADAANHKVYRLELAAKGKTKVEKAAAVAAGETPPKRTRKPKVSNEPAQASGEGDQHPATVTPVEGENAQVTA